MTYQPNQEDDSQDDTAEESMIEIKLEDEELENTYRPSKDDNSQNTAELIEIKLEEEDEEELVNPDINSLRNDLKRWFHFNPSVSEADFSNKILLQQQGTLSELFSNDDLTGKELWEKIHYFLYNKEQQRKLLKHCMEHFLYEYLNHILL